MHIKRLEEHHYDDFIELEEYSFQSSSIKSRTKRMKEIWENSYRIGVFSEENVMQSALIIRDYETYLHGEKIKMGGIGNVASYPEARGQGNVSALFHKSLEIMKEEGMIISYLAPFSYRFYRKYGYELVFEEREYNIKPSEFNRLDTGDKTIRRVIWDEEKETIMDLYNEKFKNAVGPIDRREWSWNETFKRGNNPYTSLCYNKDGKAEGYMLYHFIGQETQTFVIDELVGLNVKAEKALWEFASSHGPQVGQYNYKTASKNNLTYLFNEPRTDHVFHYGMMARIVDMEAFLKEYPFVYTEPLTFMIEVRDETATWNNGFFKIDLKENTVSVKKVGKKMIDSSRLLSSDIQNWTQLFMGTRTVEDIHYQENLCGDKDVVKAFHSVLQNIKPELYDYY